MGQRIVVTEHPTQETDLVRFEINRSLTGMAHERYVAGHEVSGHRPPDELARRLFARGDVEAIHVYSNMITVRLAPGGSAAGLREIVEDLFTYYRPGVQPAIP